MECPDLIEAVADEAVGKVASFAPQANFGWGRGSFAARIRFGPMLLGPPVVPCYPLLGEGYPAKIDCTEKMVPHSNLSTGGPRLTSGIPEAETLFELGPV